jgi:tRNA(Ile)-lysidine synthase
MMDISDKRILHQVEVVLRPYLAQPDFKLIVGVSGGPDSLALLHVLRHLCDPHQLVVAHLNHGWRESAAAEADFVARTAAEWQLTCHTETIDVTELAKQMGTSIESAGRQARYRFFARFAVQLGATAVAVAHNADDQAETLLMHLLRGSGLAGLRGMLPVRTMPEASSVPQAPELILLRPFLGITRTEIEAYCRQHHLKPITDASNTDTTYFRNRIRHELLPLLAEFNPQIKTKLQQLAAISAADYSLLEQQFMAQWPPLIVEEGDGWLILDRQRWLALPLSWRRQALRAAVFQCRPALSDVGFRAVEQARLLAEQKGAGRQAALPGDLKLAIDYEWLIVAAEPALVPIDLPQLPDGKKEICLPVPGKRPLAAQWQLEADILSDGDRSAIADNDNAWVAFVDVGPVRSLQIRARKTGERYQPLGMGGHSTSLKKEMINRKIGRLLRPSWPIVALSEHLVWLVGHHIDERVRVTATSKRIVRLRCTRISET